MFFNKSKDREQKLEAFWPKLSRIAASYEMSAQLQLELRQEMALAIWQSLNSFRGDSALETFMYRIAHNVGVGHIKKQVNQINTSNEEHDLPDHLSLEQAFSQDQAVDNLMKAIRQLPILQRQIVTLYLDGVKQQDIAKVLGMSENNIAVRINRAKNSLEQLMANES